MDSRRLYYIDSHRDRCTSRVLACREEKEGYQVLLEETVFFPEGGGQAGDQGSIGPARVLDTQEIDGQVWHLCDRALDEGESYDCRLDWQLRFSRMQAHTGEHIVSGLAHSLFGCENVGFHMGRGVTIDFDKELDWDQLMEIEQRANEAVWQDLPVTAWYPPEEELEALPYRSKLDLKENVRIVKIPGIDLCACCAPHMAHTGEVGLIKILTAQRHRGGVRLELAFGAAALEQVRLMQDNITAISQALSVQRQDTAAAVEKLLKEKQEEKLLRDELNMALARRIAQSFSCREENIVVFEDALDPVSLREMVNLLMEKTAGIAAAFAKEGEGYRYIMGSLHVDMRSKAREINSLIEGRGGGKPQMIQGSAQADRESIEKALARDFR